MRTSLRDHLVPPRYLFQRGLDPTQFIKELGELGCVKIVSLDTSRLPSLKELDPEQCYLGWTIELHTVKDLKVIEAVFDRKPRPPNKSPRR